MQRRRTTLVERGGQLAIGRLLAWDERLVNRADPPVDRPLDERMHPWSPAVVAGWDLIREELDHFVDKDVRLPETRDLAGADQGAEGLWTTCVLHWYGRWLDEHREMFPSTIRLLEDIPQLQIAGFTVLGPRAHLPRHQGPAKSLRWQMGVRVPGPAGACRLQIGDETIVWTDRATAAFDDRTPHEAWNDSDESRYVMFVQVAWPVTGLVGRAHRLNHRMFAGALRGVPPRLRALHEDLNGDPTAGS